MKITDLDIAKHYGVTTRTVTNYKKGDNKKEELYKAMRYFLECPPQEKEFKHMTQEELIRHHEILTNKMQTDIDSLQVIIDFISEKYRD